MTNEDTRYVRISGITSLVAHGVSENQTSTENYLSIASSYIINNLIQKFGLNSVGCKKHKLCLHHGKNLLSVLFSLMTQIRIINI